MFFKMLSTLQPGMAPPVDGEQAEHLQRWRLQNGSRILNVYFATSLPLYIFASVFMRLLAPPEIIREMVALFAGLAIISMVGLLLRHFISTRPTQGFLNALGVVCTLYPIAGFAVILHRSLTDYQPIVVHQIIFGFLYGMHAFLVCMSAPFLGGLTVFFNCVHAAAGIAVWLADGAPEALAWTLIVCFADAFLMAYSQLLSRQAKDQALMDYKTQTLVNQNQKLQLKAIENELNMAREIQESLAPPPDKVIVGNFTASFYYIPFGVLGGDWMAARKFDDGRMVIAVGDVTGKGVPAAMVVQSVQSLWAETLNSEDFSPLAWMQAVNNTLIVMGRNRPHTLTVGILVLEATHLTYYSAGHVPLALITTKNGKEAVTYLHGIGGVLGINPHLDIKSATFPLHRNEHLSILLGTDGVMSWKVRSRKRALLDLRHSLREQGKSALADVGDDDDKILVMIDYAG